MLAERFKITQKVGHFKAEHTLPPTDKNREADQVAHLRELAEQHPAAGRHGSCRFWMHLVVYSERKDHAGFFERRSAST